MGVRRNNEIPPLITTDGTIISDDNIKATKLNKYFCSQTDIQITDIRREHLREYENAQAETINHLDTIVFTPRDVLNVINGLDSSKACGPDKIPTRFLKMVAIYIAEPLAIIFNKSLSEANIQIPGKLRMLSLSLRAEAPRQNLRTTDRLACYRVSQKSLRN